MWYVWSASNLFLFRFPALDVYWLLKMSTEHMHKQEAKTNPAYGAEGFFGAEFPI